MERNRFTSALLVAILLATGSSSARAASFSLAGDPLLDAAGSPVAVHKTSLIGAAPGVYYNAWQMYNGPAKDVDAFSADTIGPPGRPPTLNYAGFMFGTYVITYSLKEAHSSPGGALADQELWKLEPANPVILTGVTEATLAIAAGMDVDAWDARAPNDPFIRYSVATGAAPGTASDPDGNPIPVAITPGYIYDRGPWVGTVNPIGPFNPVYSEAVIGIGIGVDDIDGWAFVLGHSNPAGRNNLALPGGAPDPTFFNTGALFSVGPNAQGTDLTGALLAADTVYWTDLNPAAPGGPTVVPYLLPGDLGTAIGDDIDALDVLGAGPRPPWLDPGWVEEVIPEPSTLMLAALAAGALLPLLFRRPRKTQTIA